MTSLCALCSPNKLSERKTALRKRKLTTTTSALIRTRTIGDRANDCVSSLHGTESSRHDRLENQRRTCASSSAAETTQTQTTESINFFFSSEKTGQNYQIWREIGYPTVKKVWRAIAVLGVPALLSVLCEPLVGFTESLLVARVGAIFLAAIAPASVMFWLIEEVCFALSTGVTTAVSSASAFKKVSNTNNAVDEVTEETREIIQASVIAGFALGCIFALTMQVCFMPVMKLLGVSGEALRLGRIYTAIRCLGLPFFAVGVTFEGAFFGEHDSKTPLKAFGTATILIVILQILFINPKFGGLLNVIGAGLAQITGQIVASSILLYQANKRGFFSISKTLRESTRNIPKLFRKTVDLLNNSDVTDSTVWLFCGSASRMVVYTILTALATSLGVIPSASNKLALDYYFFVCYAVEPLFTLGTVLIPKKMKKNKIEAWWIRKILFALSAISAVLLCFIVWALISGSIHFNLFDGELIDSLHTVTPLVCISAGLSAYAYAADGIRIGSGSADWVGKTQFVNLVLTTLLAFAMRHFVGVDMTLIHVWSCMFFFHLLRVLEHAFNTDSAAFQREIVKDEGISKMSFPT